MQKNLPQKLKTLLKSSLILTLLIMLVSCSTSFEKTLKQVEQIDVEYDMSLEDYSQGFSHFDTYIREMPLNLVELNQIISDLEDLKKGKDEDENSLAYLNFRIKLLKAENFYKSASRRPFAGLNTVIKCSKKQEMLMSIDDAKKSINSSTEAIESYFREEVKIDLTDEWVHEILNDNGKLFQKVVEKENILINFCNSSQTE